MDNLLTNLTSVECVLNIVYEETFLAKQLDFTPIAKELCLVFTKHLTLTCGTVPEEVQIPDSKSKYFDQRYIPSPSLVKFLSEQMT